MSENKSDCTPSLTPWCIINMGSIEMSALQVSGYVH
jgi:hypothetical protein